MSETLRRSTRTVIPTTVFTIDNPIPTKRKRQEPPPPPAPSAIAKPTPTVPKITVPTVHFCTTDSKILGNSQCSSNSVPPTMFTDRSLDSVLHRHDPTSGTLLQRDLEELKGKGMNMTVKELLAKNFKNYKVRPSLTSERATEIVNRTLSENDVPHGALLSGPPVIPATVKISSFYPQRVTEENGKIRKGMQISYEFPRNGEQPSLQAALESLVNSDAALSKEAKEIKTEPGVEAGLDEYANQVLSTLNESESSSCSLEPIAYPGNHLPWPVFWKSVPSQYKQGDIYLYIGDTVYTQMSEVIKAGRFLVPLHVSVLFIFEEKVVEVTLNELLTANGINLTNAQHFRMLQGLLQKAGVHIRSDYAERLHELQGVTENSDLLHKARPPITITGDKLPLVCKQPDIFMMSLGKRLHGAILVDTSGDKPPIPNQTYQTTIYSQPLSFDTRRQILILHDTEVPIPHIAERYTCTVRSILETIGTRVLIERHQIDQHLLENPWTPDGLHSDELTTTATVGDVMRPRNKIRRTHYVDLNKLVWQHFKDCQAQGVQINGKHLKDQAMRYAKEMGLESFRGSEGWLDAFKRRHKIDLKTMTGFPVCYGSEMFDEVDQECRDMSPLMDHHHSHQSSSFLMPPTHQDDFASSFFSTLNLPEPTASSSTHLQNMINSMMTPLPSLGSNLAHSGVSEQVEHSTAPPETFYNVMKSCQIRVADKEVSLALDTIRTYILAHDPAAMNLLVPLQERLARSSTGIAAALANDQTSSSTS